MPPDMTFGEERAARQPSLAGAAQTGACCTTGVYEQRTRNHHGVNLPRRLREPHRPLSIITSEQRETEIVFLNSFGLTLKRIRIWAQRTAEEDRCGNAALPLCMSRIAPGGDAFIRGREFMTVMHGGQFTQ